MDNRNVMLISPNTVKSLGTLSLNVDDTMIGAAIRTAQEVYLKDVIGEELVERLKELVGNKINNSGSTIDDVENTAYKVLLDDYVKQVLASKVLIEVEVEASLKTRNIGVVKNSDTNASFADSKELSWLLDYHRTAYNHYLNRMAEYLCQQKAAIPESRYDCGCGPKKKYANINLFLG